MATEGNSILKYEYPALVLGLFETGLGVIRSLGRSGIKVFGVDYKKDIGYYSKYVVPIILSHPQNKEADFIEGLLNFLKKQDKPLPIFITSDEYLQILIKYRHLLSKYLLYNGPNSTLIQQISNKYSQYLLAQKADINVPKTVIIEDERDIEKIKELRFPIFIKGIDVNAWRKAFGGSLKGFKANTLDDYYKIYKNIRNFKLKLLVQEIIEGPDTNHVKYCTYINKNGQITAEFCLKKIRQAPPHFGIGCVVESIYDTELIEIGRKLFTGIGYRGVGSAEFKLDNKENNLKLIEINPRYWQQNSLAAACGINFPLIQYLDLTGEPFPKLTSYQEGIKWVNIYSDINSFFSYRKEDGLSFGKWLHTLKGKKIFSDFSKDDLLPSLYEIRFGMKLLKVPLYLLKKYWS
ncbi:hypothetical protein ACSSV9_14155 [Melioribacter sp. OK-6-Me]|uniref:carboxylate--amine ligase n=1 Tax=Melioribacter sp. OK-6-Me TaxID=3423433 RepID=UPI003ED99F7E